MKGNSNKIINLILKRFKIQPDTINLIPICHKFENYWISLLLILQTSKHAMLRAPLLPGVIADALPHAIRIFVTLANCSPHIKEVSLQESVL